MTISYMLGQSLVLTLLGIGVVFAFIIVMIACLTLVHRIVHSLKLDAEAAAETPAASVPAAASAGTAHIAAIAAAVRAKQG
ncbi:OadG family protein [Treponema endosymbiont of Eucomonympha sp.]|uniref:OadG family protein n=1 Tax=Treponema endosymbiont of Eucomonympha sp. TaxID=1580831 RepID=UPI00078154E2|nr:OadG family protein [Treponema endosymbiont of Eucomonympha sp.]